MKRHYRLLSAESCYYPIVSPILLNNESGRSSSQKKTRARARAGGDSLSRRWLYRWFYSELPNLRLSHGGEHSRDERARDARAHGIDARKRRSARPLGHSGTQNRQTRGLGHAGGTLDKLEAIPGFEIRIDEERFRELIASVGCALIGQSDGIAPADRKLYALRDVTATIDSLPLITGSILSKKLAEGISGLVLDVKFGSGAFMKTVEEASALADLLLKTVAHMGTRAVALLTDMNQPLGNYVGNALEVEESIAVLKGHGARDLAELSLTLTAHMLVLGDVARTVEDGEKQARQELQSGRGLEKLRQIVKAQGGDAAVIDEPRLLPKAGARRDLKAAAGGHVSVIETEALGRAAMLIGAGRRTVDDVIDPAAGLVIHKKLGDEVTKSEPLLTFHYNDDTNLEEASELVANAYQITDTPPASRDLVHSVLTTKRKT